MDMHLPLKIAETVPLKDRHQRSLQELRVSVMDLLAHFRGLLHSVRLIEYMDVGNSNHWSKSDVIPNAEWIETIGQKWPIRPVESENLAETARRYEYLDGQGEIGFISSIWADRNDRYSEERGQPGHDQKKVEMYRLGG